MSKPQYKNPDPVEISKTDPARLIQDEWSTQLLELVRSVGQQITDVYDLEELARKITRDILDTFHYYYVAIFTYRKDQNLIQFRASAKATSPDSSAAGVSEVEPVVQLKVGQGIIGRVARSGKEVCENIVAKSKYYFHSDLLPETKAEYALPIINRGELIGILDVQSDEENAFRAVDALVLRTLADHLAVAVTNTYLYTEVNRQVKHLALVAEISKAISSILDFNHLLNNIVSLIHVRFGVPRVNIFTVHPGRGKIIFRAGAGQIPAAYQLVPEEFSYDLKSHQGLVPRGIGSKQSLVSNDLESDSKSHTASPALFNVLSELAIPLIFGDQVLGALDLQSPRKGEFSEEDVQLYISLADYLSVAFRNANLYSSEQWRRSVSESVSEVAGLLSADIDLGHVLNSILIELHKTLPCDISAIWLLDDFQSDDGIGQYTSPLRLAAIHTNNDSEGAPRSVDHLNLQELIQLNDTPSYHGPWMIEALYANAPIIRSNASPYEPLGSYLNYPDDYSAIAAPLRAGEQTLGLLVLVHKSTGRYGSESQAMTALFANYSAVAIKNTRLYEAAHDQAWVATVLLQVAEATQSITVMSELLETIARIVPTLVGIKSCAILLWDFYSETFVPAVADGLTDIQESDFMSWRIAPGDIPAFDQLFDQKSAVILDKTNIPLENNQAPLPSLDIEHDVLGLFPMISQNELRGAILVNFTPQKEQGPSSSSLSEEKFLLIQGIAGQTAVAVENILLLQSQEEEAYISVALLQVAQAIVTLNKLSDILNTIVRITPILVGVKRCAIYLVSEDSSLYTLSQTYGISKNELSLLPGQYHAQDHYFLRLVHSTGHFAVRYLVDEEESPLRWENYSQDDIVLFASPSNTVETTSGSDNHEFMNHRGRLLFGLPLSSKGHVLGIMIIEEAENPKGTPSYHLRQRRFELINGITQQAALAIHNDRLQKEVLGRERLEREMQLAREIQTTFLPESIPEIPGWDLDIFWRPALQVSGDFYDIIPIGDGRVGLVIADVADKGMPAALFMTLVRTLIRAAAKDHHSPAEILMQVNNLLVPDAKQGMFVTLLMVIYSPHDGSLLYANAGHNPPILSSEASSEELAPTGMALGVIEGTQITERMLQINPGDRLLFYTDGVTDALASDEEMFGINRLHDIMKKSEGCTASGLLEQIQINLTQFVAGATQTDDLTIAVLIRTVD